MCRVSEARYISLQLARFDMLRAICGLRDVGVSGMPFCSVAADTRGAGTEPVSMLAFVFLIFGLHENADSAHQFLDARDEAAPWLRHALEAWSGVLEPTRHKGEANFLNRETPGTLFETLAPELADSAPFVAITSAGWKNTDGANKKRISEFSTGVLAVRAAMTAVDGMHSQQSFFFPGVLKYDHLTVSFWRDSDAASAYLYGPGVHRHQMERQRTKNLADRTSFTRCTVLRSEGTWYGRDPSAWGS